MASTRKWLRDASASCRRAGISGILIAAALAACETDGLITLPDPDLITLPIVSDTANLPQLRNGVVFEFARAYTGPAENNATPGIIGLSGLLADELWYASTFGTMREIDARDVDVTNDNLLEAFRYIHRARNLAENAIALYEQSPRAGSGAHALVTNLAGFTYIFLAENFCSGVPVSRAPFTGPVTYGPPRTTNELFTLAVTRFNSAQAIAAAAGEIEQLNLARVGKARALLGLGRLDDAAAAAADVPTSFEYEVKYGDLPSPQNGVWYNINAERRSSAASSEGVNGIRFFDRGVPTANPDPRAPADSLGTGIGTKVPLYRQLKYGDGTAGVLLATGIEARLIEAERVMAMQNPAYLPVLNALRAAIGLPDLADPGPGAPRVHQLFNERAFWLWLTAHRLGDLRRLIRQYGFTPADVFPVGQTIFGGSYGDDINFPVPFEETNNPEFSDGQCLDRGA